MSSTELNNAKTGWWNGVNILVKDRDHVLPEKYPPIDESRVRYFNDHIVHSAKYSEYAPELLSIATAPYFKMLLKMTSFYINRPKYQLRKTALNMFSKAK